MYRLSKTGLFTEAGRRCELKKTCTSFQTNIYIFLLKHVRVFFNRFPTKYVSESNPFSIGGNLSECLLTTVGLLIVFVAYFHPANLPADRFG